VWVYEGNLKVEYQATALSLYELSIEKKTGEITEVKNPRRLETHFRGSQLDLSEVQPENEQVWHWRHIFNVTSRLVQRAFSLVKAEGRERPVWGHQAIGESAVHGRNNAHRNCPQ